MDKLGITPEEHLEILEDLRKNNRKEIIIVEIQIKMGANMLEKAKVEDEIAKKNKKKDDKSVGGEKAIGIQMKIDAFKAQTIEMYDGLAFINKEIDEVSKIIKDAKK